MEKKIKRMKDNQINLLKVFGYWSQLSSYFVFELKPFEMTFFSELKIIIN